MRMPGLQRIVVCIGVGCAAVTYRTETAWGGTPGVQVYDLRADWSDAVNPNGRWVYLEGLNPLPHVASWQSVLGGWSVAQPGWAKSENGNDRLPFWYRSNGSENFACDLLAGDVVVHSTDGTNGVGNGIARVRWTAPGPGKVDISGGVWIGRDIGRANTWRLKAGDTVLRSGTVSSGDAFSRASPALFSSASGGGQLNQRPVGCNGSITLEVEQASTFGDFVGINFTIAFTPSACISDLNADGTVSTPDLTQLLVQFGQSGTGLCADLNHDGSVTTADLVLFLASFGASCG